MKKVLVFGASSSHHSINKKLATFAGELVKKHHKNCELDILDLNDYEVAIFSVDKEGDIPKKIYEFSQKIIDCDLIVISMAEHNGSYSAAFKNIFDWVSRIPERKVFADKPMLVLATSPGARGGSSVLETATKRFPFNGGKVLDSFSLPNFNENFSEKEGITNSELKTKLEDLIKKLKF